MQAEARRRQLDRPNSPDEWQVLYAAPVTPVVKVESPVAQALVQLSVPGDVMLETGCGSASISAELGVADRIVQLADFSPAILERAQRLFAASGLSAPLNRLADLTQPLPWADKSVDITWSSGVLEHWQDDELVPILREMARVSRKRVVSFVPFAGSVFYRWGKWVSEQNGSWPYGRELPRQSLCSVFERAGLQRIVEYTLWPDAALNFMHMVDPELAPEVHRWWHAVPADDPLRRTQGYLLATIGEPGP
ncbi:class I SAM-dependent methyltransferase [Opitutus terrae]|uniref:class I SAM-dependent methyltransferase n=1 Tax=Opitutus terrae TaxID=107709 RepID=UPI0005D0F1C9|nr:class I SAM-dependent methyltransferase [Opitutus terrae]